MSTKYKKLLIAWVYQPAVGHLVEVLQVAANYYAAHLNLKGANKLSFWFNEVLKSDILKTKSYSKLDDFIANFNIK